MKLSKTRCHRRNKKNRLLGCPDEEMILPRKKTAAKLRAPYIAFGSLGEASNTTCYVLHIYIAPVSRKETQFSEPKDMEK